jgi:Disulphide bond corrector protein DsbC
MNAMNKLATVAVVISCLGSLPAMGQEPLKLWDEDYIRVRTGVTIRVVVHASIETGYYIVAAGGTNAKLTPLTLKLAPTEGITLGTPEYPTAKLVRLQQDALELPGFEGLLEIGVSLQVSTDVKWESKPMSGTLAYQACDGRKCLPPASLPIQLNIEIRPDVKPDRSNQSGARPSEVTPEDNKKP